MKPYDELLSLMHITHKRHYQHTKYAFLEY